VRPDGRRYRIVEDPRGGPGSGTRLRTGVTVLR